MEKLSKLYYQSVMLASRQPSWWLFALLQAACFSLIGQLARPLLILQPFNGFLLLLSVVVLAPLTIIFWQDVARANAGVPEERRWQNFASRCWQGLEIILSTVAVILLSRFLFPFWPVHTLVFALAASTAGLALLYLSLFRQALGSAVRLSFYTWSKNTLFAGVAVGVLVMAHAISFVLVHGVWENFYFREFSVPGHSATIWVLLTVLMLLIAYFGAVLNCFVVLLFLDSVKPKKSEEAEKAAVVQKISMEPT